MSGESTASPRPAYHRGGQASIFGKRTEDARTKIATDTKEGLRRIWTDLGYQSESEFLAHLIEIRVHGFEHVSSVQADRLRAVAGIGQEKGK